MAGQDRRYGPNQDHGDAAVTPALAFVSIDGELRTTCVGCTTALEQRGMVKRVREILIPAANVPPHTYCTAFYEIAFPYTLDFCQRAIRDRHTGLPWGEKP
jgi:hypothetical protein